MSRKLYDFEVTGRVTPSMSFPFDMLRYDCAWPADPEAVSQLFSAVYFAPDQREKTLTLRLRSHQKPTVDRWRSFNWGCRPLEHVA